MTVSIPRSGFCSFKPCHSSVPCHRHASFNPSVGILFIQADRVGSGRRRVDSFNPSVGILFIQAQGTVAALSDLAGGFNPSVGILFIQAIATARDVAGATLVSIPRSGFCSFKRCPIARAKLYSFRFNPSVGILFIQASIMPPAVI